MIVAQGILTSRGGLVSHAAVVARGWGKPAVVGAEAVRISRTGLHRRWGHGSTRATSSPSTGRPGSVVLGEVPLERGRSAGGVQHHPRVGRRDPQGPAGRAGQRRQRSRRGQRPPLRGRGDRPVPHRAHVPGRGPAADRAAHDPGRRARRRRRPPSRSCAVAQKAGLRRDPRSHGRPAGHRAAARSAPARVPAVDRGAADQEGHRRV